MNAQSFREFERNAQTGACANSLNIQSFREFEKSGKWGLMQKV